MSIDEQVANADFTAGLTPETLELMKALVFATKAQDEEDNLLVSKPTEEQKAELISIGRAWVKWSLTVAA